jgi:hypothetical protein
MALLGHFEPGRCPLGYQDLAHPVCDYSCNQVCILQKFQKNITAYFHLV